MRGPCETGSPHLLSGPSTNTEQRPVPLIHQCMGQSVDLIWRRPGGQECRAAGRGRSVQPVTLTTILDRGALAGSPGRHTRPRMPDTCQSSRTHKRDCKPIDGLCNDDGSYRPPPSCAVSSPRSTSTARPACGGCWPYRPGTRPCRSAGGGYPGGLPVLAVGRIRRHQSVRGLLAADTIRLNSAVTSSWDRSAGQAWTSSRAQRAHRSMVTRFWVYYILLTGGRSKWYSHRNRHISPLSGRRSGNGPRPSR